MAVDKLIGKRVSFDLLGRGRVINCPVDGLKLLRFGIGVRCEWVIAFTGPALDFLVGLRVQVKQKRLARIG